MEIEPLPSDKHLHNYGKSPCLMGKSTISMAIFNSYVKSITVVGFKWRLWAHGKILGKCLSSMGDSMGQFS